MKKLFYLFSLLLVGATACEPLEDMYEELDALPEAKRSFAITLTEADYKSINGKPGVPATVASGLYFNSEKQAGDLIPLILNAKYGHLNDRDVIDVTYNTASPATVAERVEYTLTDADYALGGTNFKNFDSWGQIETFLNAKFPTPLEGRLVSLTFTKFNSNTNPTSSTVTDTYFYANGKWYDTYMVTNENYASVERSRNNAFASGDEAVLIPAALNKFLKESIVGAKVGDMQYASYLIRYSSSSTLRQVTPLFFNGVNWVSTKPATLSFVKKQGVWVADPIVKYTLTSADYIWIGDNETLSASKGKRDNLKQFKNFYQRFTDNANYWKQSEILEALGALLKERFPTATEGQKFEVTYMLHTGPTGPASVVLQLQDGKFVEPAE